MIEEIPVPAPPRPWREIWFHPRATIRAILKYNYIEACEPLAMVVGVFWIFFIWLEVASGSLLALPFIWFAPLTFTSIGGIVTAVVMTLIGSSFFGYFAMRWLASAIVWFGRGVGSEADKKVIYPALTWSAVPLVGAIPLQIAFLFLAFSWMGRDLFAVAPHLIFLKMIIGGLGAWHLALAIAMVAEVTRVRLWRAALWVVGFPLFLAVLPFAALFLCFFIDVLLMSRNL